MVKKPKQVAETMVTIFFFPFRYFGRVALRMALAAALALASGAAAPALALEAILVPPSHAVPAGQKLTAKVIYKNPAQSPETVSLEKEPRFELVLGEKSRAVTGDCDNEGGRPGFELTPGQYRERVCSFVIPPDLSGFARLRLQTPASNTVIVEIAPFGKSLAQAGAPAGKPAKEDTKLADMESKIHPFLSNLTFYEPIYFLVGTDPEKSKFQLSFKYRLFQDESPLAEKYDFFRGLHFAYTQTSFWDLAADSAPFEDTSYKPEIFWLSRDWGLKLPYLYTANVQIGAQHESNGRGGIDSRSTNTVYIRPIFMFARQEEDAGIMVAPRIMVYVGNDEHTNPDLPDYRGYVDLEIKTGMLGRFILTSHLKYGEKGGSALFDLSHPLKDYLGKNIDLYFYSQYFTGYAESLLHYDEKESALRFGFAIAR